MYSDFVIANSKTAISFSYYSAGDCLLFMQNGSELHKFRSSSRQYSRFFYVDEDLSCLRWSPSTKKADKAKSEWLCIQITYALTKIYRRKTLWWYGRAFMSKTIQTEV